MGGENLMELNAISEAVIAGRHKEVPEMVREALNEGKAPDDILNKALIAAMGVVGDQFERGEMYVPEMLVAARAMQAGLNVLKPFLGEAGVKAAGKVVIGTVQGDLHDIGKNLVRMMLEGSGFEVKDLGTDVSPARFVEAVDKDTDIVAMSALLTTTMPQMKNTIEALTEAGKREKVKVLVGGAPLTSAFAEEIGADGYAPDAASAVRKAKQVMGI
jgi:5-methyltetrahydrofolate--homocysteine methyltransferase